MKKNIPLALMLFSVFCSLQIANAKTKAKSKTKAGKAKTEISQQNSGQKNAQDKDIDKATLGSKYNLAEGKKLYNESCTSCHATGLLSAPKLGDTKAWKPRVALGMESLVNHTVKGYKSMPPMGGVDTLSETLTIEQATNTVAYMVEQSLD